MLAVCGNSSEIWMPDSTVRRELELRPHQLRVRIDERGPIALEQLGRRQRAVVLHELRLVVEQLQMARRPGHEQEDDILRPRREMRPLRQRAGGSSPPQRARQAARSAIDPNPTPHSLRNQRRASIRGGMFR